MLSLVVKKKLEGNLEMINMSASKPLYWSISILDLLLLEGNGKKN